jgi:DNA-directed RNA polymerase sigma subunit (sigma70/sigma32)
MGVTRERIRQIQEEALHKLRAGMEAREHPSTEEPAAFAVAA